MKTIRYIHRKSKQIYIETILDYFFEEVSSLQMERLELRRTHKTSKIETNALVSQSRVIFFPLP